MPEVLFEQIARELALFGITASWEHPGYFAFKDPNRDLQWAVGTANGTWGGNDSQCQNEGACFDTGIPDDCQDARRIARAIYHGIGADEWSTPALSSLLQAAETAAAISDRVHSNLEAYHALYSRVKEAWSGFPGVWTFIAQCAVHFNTRCQWEEADWIDLAEKIAEAILEAPAATKPADLVDQVVKEFYVRRTTAA